MYHAIPRRESQKVDNEYQIMLYIVAQCPIQLYTLETKTQETQQKFLMNKNVKLQNQPLAGRSKFSTYM